jgi:NAD(P)H-dependent FMN reductase
MMTTLLDPNRPLFIPVILGTGREGRRSEPVANFVFSEVRKREHIETELIDIRTLPICITGPSDELKDPVLAAKMMRADALVLVAPEYNHGYPGLLKHVLDMNLEEYIHKAVGICGVSASPFGGARMIENFLPVLRELGLMTIFTDVNFGNAEKLFDEHGQLLDQSYVRRVGGFLDELIWMARVLRYGRENIPVA